MQFAKMLEMDADHILPSRICDLKWEARRPMDSSLDTSKASRMLANKPLGLDDSLQILKNEFEIL